MNGSRQEFCRSVLCAAGLMLVLPAAAQNAADPAAALKLLSVPANLMPPPPQSPVSIFRKLLAMTPQERVNYLTNRPAEIRNRILAKVGEYLALDPGERELRLDATELRWFLLPLLRDSPTNRDARLAQVPDNLRDLARSRLEQWDALPPQSRQEFLDNEEALHYFTHVATANAPPEPVATRGPGEDAQARWQALSEEDRRRITGEFNDFFGLTQEEKQKTLNTLSAAERAQMEQTLQTFGKLPPAQRAQCIRAFTEFASMTPQDRQEFLKNAERWSQLPPKERQVWRDLVAQVPLWPPLPQALVRPPPLPPRLPLHSRPMVATNRN